MNRAVRVCAVLMALLAAPAVAGCGGPRQVSFPAGSTMDRLHRAGKITIGVKSDQPGLGFRNPATGTLEGFDIRIAEIITDDLGLSPDRITYLESATKDREVMLAQGRVDLVIASYSITDERRRTVGLAGPYFVTGQRLMVRAEDRNRIGGPDDLSTSRVCSVLKSTSIPWAEQRFGDRLVQYATYTDCVRQLLNGSVRAVLTDGAVLLGYAAQQPNKLAVVGPTLSTERYGIGYGKGDRALCEFVTDAIRRAEADGSWDGAFADTLGLADPPAPIKPTPEPCQP